MAASAGLAPAPTSLGRTDAVRHRRRAAPHVRCRPPLEALDRARAAPAKDRARRGALRRCAEVRPLIRAPSGEVDAQPCDALGGAPSPLRTRVYSSSASLSGRSRINPTSAGEREQTEFAALD